MMRFKGMAVIDSRGGGASLEGLDRAALEGTIAFGRGKSSYRRVG